MKNISLLLAVCLLASCTSKVDGHTEETVISSVEKIAKGLDAADSQQFNRDIVTIATSMPTQEVPLYLDGMTREEISSQANIIRLKADVERTKFRIANMEARHEKFMGEATIRDNAATELAKVQLALQPVEEDGAVVNCALLVHNGSSYGLQSLTWENPELGQVLTHFDPVLSPGESRTMDDCGVGSAGGESATRLIAASREKPPVALWADLPNDGPDLRSWDSPQERKRTLFFYGDEENYAGEMSTEKQNLANAEAKLQEALSLEK